MTTWLPQIKSVKYNLLEVDNGQMLAYFWNNNNQKKEKKNVQFYKSLTSCIERVSSSWLKWLTRYREIGGTLFTGKLASDPSPLLLSHIPIPTFLRSQSRVLFSFNILTAALQIKILSLLQSHSLITNLTKIIHTARERYSQDTLYAYMELSQNIKRLICL